VSKTDVLLLGGSGLVGSGARERWAEALRVDAPSHTQLDVLDGDALAAYLRQSRAEVVVNLAAWADVDGAEPERGQSDGRVYRLNVTFPERLAQLCGELRKHLIHVSTDYVFDGANAERPYKEDDPTRAVCWYAETKLGGEQAVLSAGASACVARIEMPYTGRQHAKRDLARTIVARVDSGQPIQGVTDQRITPVFLDDAADALSRLVDARYTGLIHVAAASWTTPFEFAVSIARRLGLDAALIQPATFERFAQTRPAPRPQHSWLDVSLFRSLFGDSILRPVEDALDAWVGQFQPVRT
jgi:dTDP-4-dehydrorhamnose reductase